MATLRDALKNAGFKASPPKVFDVQILIGEANAILIGATWRGIQFLKVEELDKVDHKTANRLANAAVAEGLEVSLNGRRYVPESSNTSTSTHT